MYPCPPPALHTATINAKQNVNTATSGPHTFPSRRALTIFIAILALCPGGMRPHAAKSSPHSAVNAAVTAMSGLRLASSEHLSARLPLCSPPCCASLPPTTTPLLSLPTPPAPPSPPAPPAPPANSSALLADPSAPPPCPPTAPPPRLPPTAPPPPCRPLPPPSSSLLSPCPLPLHPPPPPPSAASPCLASPAAAPAFAASSLAARARPSDTAMDSASTTFARDLRHSSAAAPSRHLAAAGRGRHSGLEHAWLTRRTCSSPVDQSITRLGQSSSRSLDCGACGGGAGVPYNMTSPASTAVCTGRENIEDPPDGGVLAERRRARWM